MTEPRPSPVLRLEDARIDATGDGPLAEAMTVTATGARIALIGEWQALFRLLTREARVTAGLAEIAGIAADLAVTQGVLGVTRREGPLSLDWRGDEYVVASARLAGLGRGAAAAARRALSRLGLERLGRRPLRGLSPVERRALLLAHAIVNEPAVLACEDPFDGLTPGAAAGMRAVLDRAAAGRSLIASSRHADGGSAAAGLVASAETVLVRDGRGQVAGVSPGDYRGTSGRRTALVVLEGLTRLADALRARGLSIEEERLLLDERAVAPGSAPIPGGERPRRELGGRLVVRLATDEDGDAILRAAQELGCTLLELVPLPATSLPDRPRDAAFG